jgi:hypothetical protein
VNGGHNEKTHLSHLLPATSNVIVSDIGKVCLLLFPLDWVSLGMDDLVKISRQSMTLAE